MRYRRITKKDKFPELPKGIKPKLLSKVGYRTFIIAEDKDIKYTLIWDRMSPHFNEIYTEHL